MNACTLAATFAIAGLCATTAQAMTETIGFEDFGNVGTSGPTVTNQYPDVLFSSTGGNVNIVTTQPGIGFGNDFLCTGSPTINCTGETILDFSVPVNALSFYAVGSNNAGNTAKVDIYVNHLLAATQNITTNGIFNTPNFVNLASFNDVTRIRIYDITDGGGLGWDNFTFTTTVPEPGTLVLLMGGLVAFAGLARRRAGT